MRYGGQENCELLVCIISIDTDTGIFHFDSFTSTKEQEYKMARHKEISIYNKIKYTILRNYDGHEKGTVNKKKAVREKKTTDN